MLRLTEAAVSHRLPMLLDYRELRGRSPHRPAFWPAAPSRRSAATPTERRRAVVAPTMVASTRPAADRGSPDPPARTHEPAPFTPLAGWRSGPYWPSSNTARPAATTCRDIKLRTPG